MMSVAGAGAAAPMPPSSSHALSAERQARLEQAQEAKRAQAERQMEQQTINQLSARDKEVRAHEQAHVAAGGQYAGAALYQSERGPNGVNYAVSGEVSISVSKESTPEETLQKAQIVRRAALAPAEPSPQDRRVAAMATRMEAEARQEIAQQKVEENAEQKAVEEAESQDDEAEAVQASAQSDQQQDAQQNALSRQRDIIESSYNSLSSRSSSFQAVA